MKEYTRNELRELTARILERGITLESLATAAGVRETLVIEIMKGRLRPTLEIRKSLASALGIDVSVIE